MQSHNSNYNRAVTQNIGDYQSIMEAYRRLLGNAQGRNSMSSSGGPNGRQTFNPTFVQPQQYQYSSDPAHTESIGRMRNLSDTGGYSETDKADLRSRGISPIRSIYAGANRDMARRNALSGGTAANYGALRSRNAREMSDLVSGATQNVNAGIAENVARNKMSSTSQLAGLTGQESALRNQYGSANTDRVNRANETNAGISNSASQYNIELPFRYNAEDRAGDDGMFRAVEGMRSLFGTTPGMSSMFGNRSLQQNQLESQNVNSGNNNIMEIIRQMMQRRNAN